MTATAVVTVVRVTVRRTRRILRLSSLLRYALSTAKPSDNGKPNLLPTKIPNHCANDLFRCRKLVRWIVGDGRNHVFFCASHIEDYWSGHDTLKHTVESIQKGKYLR